MNLKKIIFYLILITFPLGQLCRFQLNFWPNVTFHPIEFLVFLFVIIWGVGLVFQKERQVAPLFFKEMTIFGLLALLSLVINIPKYGFNLPGFFYLCRLGNFFLFYWAARDFFEENKLPLLKYLLWISLTVSVLSLGQYLFLPDTRFLFNLGWDMHYFRAIGPFLDPSFGALIEVLGIIVLVNFIWGREEKRERFWQIFSGILLLLGIALSFSRLAYVSLILAMIIFLIRKKAVKFLFYFLPFFAFLVLLLPKPTGEGVDLLRKSSFVNRTDNYRKTLIIIKDNFLTGVGFNNFRLAQKNYGFISESDWLITHAGGGADNSFLFVLATCGGAGGIAFLYLWIKILLKTKASLLLLPTTGVIIFSSFFVNSLFYPWIVIWFMMLLADFTAGNKL